MEGETILSMINVSVMFNKDGKKDPQSSLKDLCKNYLNLKFPASMSPFAVSLLKISIKFLKLNEARICMALYQQKLARDASEG